MYASRVPHSIFALLLVGLTGCIGTDFITDPLPVFDPKVEVTPAQVALELGDTVTLEATYYDDTGESVQGVAVAWQSSDAERASVDARGVVTAHALGQVQIVASVADSVHSAPVLLTVVADPNQVAQVTISPDSLTVQVGAQASLVVRAYNLSGDELGAESATWSSADPRIASVDAGGVVTALASGTTVITTLVDGVASPPAVVTVPGGSRTGSFTHKPGTSYRLSGSATLQEREDGTLDLSFSDDFSSSNGPNLVVYLSSTNSVNGRSLPLGNLQSTQGAQTYAVPSDVTLDAYDWVLIHCVPFNVTFGFAELR
ncbi:MAG: DM13 domain-containing protein [Bacteroidota bacterium]